MLRRPQTKRERRRVRRANRWLKKYRVRSTNKIVNMLCPLMPDHSRNDIAEFVKNLQTVATVIPK